MRLATPKMMKATMWAAGTITPGTEAQFGWINPFCKSWGGVFDNRPCLARPPGGNAWLLVAVGPAHCRWHLDEVPDSVPHTNVSGWQRRQGSSRQARTGPQLKNAAQPLHCLELADFRTAASARQRRIAATMWCKAWSHIPWRMPIRARLFYETERGLGGSKINYGGVNSAGRLEKPGIWSAELIHYHRDLERDDDGRAAWFLWSFGPIWGAECSGWSAGTFGSGGGLRAIPGFAGGGIATRPR